MHPLCFSAAALSLHLIQVRELNPKSVKLASSSVSVMYNLGLGLSIAEPSAMPVDDMAKYIRKTAAIEAPRPDRPNECFDLATPRRWLLSRGPLTAQSLQDLVESVTYIARLFYGFRAADLAAVPFPAKGWNRKRGIDEAELAFWNTKTAAAVCPADNLWQRVKVRWLDAGRLVAGLGLERPVAEQLVASCCFLTGLEELRCRLLPKLQRTTEIEKLQGCKVWARSLLPYVKTSLKNSKAVQFLSATRINKIVEKCHHEAGLPDMGTAVGFYPRHYRHVALTMLHFVGCADQAKEFSLHTKDSRVFETTYRVQLVDDRFVSRHQQVQLRPGFALLSAAERLLL